MREIKFRGRKEGSRVWDFGNYATSKDGKLFLVDIAKDNVGYITYLREVNPKTVGQYTGLKDKNGVEIYEGDVLDHKGWVVSYPDFIPEKDESAIGLAVGWFVQRDNWESFEELIYGEKYEVIGNIYDNPALKEVTE